MYGDPGASFYLDVHRNNCHTPFLPKESMPQRRLWRNEATRKPTYGQLRSSDGTRLGPQFARSGWPVRSLGQRRRLAAGAATPSTSYACNAQTNAFQCSDRPPCRCHRPARSVSHRAGDRLLSVRCADQFFYTGGIEQDVPAKQQGPNVNHQISNEPSLVVNEGRSHRRRRQSNNQESHGYCAGALSAPAAVVGSAGERGSKGGLGADNGELCQ